MYNVTALKGEIQAFIHGTTLNQVVNVDGLIYRAARQLVLDVDPQEMKRIKPLASAIYDRVYDYPIPDDVKGNKVIDIRPQANRNASDSFLQTYSKPFDLSKDSLLNQFNIDFNSGVKTIRIADSGLVPGVVVNDADSIDSNGLWVTGGTASNIAIDNINYVSGGASLKFDATTGAAYLENSTMDAQDLSAWKNQGHFFLWVYMPTAIDFTNVKLRWGSDSSNYYEQTVTVNQQGNAFVDGWNLLDFPWLNAVQTLTPIDTAINYLRLTCNVTAAQTAIRLDNIVFRLGTILEIVYYSKFLFKDAITGGWQETITDDSNIINLDTESYNLLVYQVGIHLAQQLQGLDAMFYDGNYFQGHYSDALGRYRQMYKSEIQKPEQQYYSMNRPGYSKYMTRRNW